jgi:RNA polymerase sigma factor (TIGR02999 family)
MVPERLAVVRLVRMSPVTRLLDAAAAGDPNAAHELLPLVYDELRKLAATRMANERPDHTLDSTALVHEAYLRLVGDQRFDGRDHFFAAAAEAMRRILVNHARDRKRLKRGGGNDRVELNSDIAYAPQRDDRLLALDEALERFAAIEPHKAELLKLRSFAGLSLDQAAGVLGISPSTADRWWAYARAWLRLEISGENFE